MALHANLVWEVRTSASSDSNGGGFKSTATGSDYSLQDSPEVVFTDMVIDGSTNTIFTSAARPGVDADVGNIISVTSGTGFTVQRVEITAVNSGAYTVDKSLGTLGSTGGNGRLGGAIQDIQTALTLMTVAGMTCYVQAGDGYTLGSSQLATAANGAATTPMKLIGYDETRGDGGQVTITAGDTTPTRVLFVNHTFWNVLNFIVDCADIVETGIQMAGASGYVENCTATQWTQRGIYLAARGCWARDCWATDGTGGSSVASTVVGAFAWGADGCRFERCHASASASNGFMGATATIADINDCLVRGMSLETSVGGHGVTGLGTCSARVTNCTFASLAGSGIYAQASGGMAELLAENNLFATITRYGFESGSSNYSALTTSYARRMRNNAFYSVTLGKQDSDFPAGVDEISLTADPFMDFANLDLRLNNAAGGGALARGAGVPGALLGLGATVLGGMDIGALQANSGGTAHEEAIALWREWTGEFSSTRIPDTVVNRYLQSGLVEINRILGYAFTDDTITLVTGTQEYTQPTGTVEVVFIEHNGKRLEKVDLEEEERQGRDWRNRPASTPKQWAHYGNKIVLIPEPDAAAVSATSTATVRFLRSPRDVGTYGPEGLEEAEWRTAVRWAAQEFSAAHPDSATAQMRRAAFTEMFQQAAAGAVEFYLRRRLSRGAASEVLGASGVQRRKG